jgi:CHAT domain-containing protein
MGLPSRAGCPDPGLIAAHAERRLAGVEAARMDAHLSTCRDCAEVFAETVRFTLEDEAAEPVAPPVTPLPLFRRRAFQAAALVALAAALVLAVRLVGRARGAHGPLPLVAELAQAMGEQRFVEPRLSGGFRHGPLLTLRGEAPRGLDAYPPAVLSAVARVRQHAEADPSPEALGALGITYLVSGDLGAAVKALESATAQAPASARLQSDLSAAYLVRANRQDEAADLPRALEAAERAIALERPPDEAWFNRALALEKLHLVDAARKAWEDYIAHDSSSGWADEARRHLEELEPSPRSSTEPDRTRVRATLDKGAGAVDGLAAEDPSQLRDGIQYDLFPAWAEAFLAGRPEEPVLRSQARMAGEALARTNGEALPRDAARALEPDDSAAGPAALEAQALGYRALRGALRLYADHKASCAPFREARRLLEQGGSPYASWVGERVVTACFYPAHPQPAFDELARIGTVAKQRGYLQLLGRVRWMQGLFHARRAELAAALDRYREAGASFRAARDSEGEVAVHALIGEVLGFMGEDGRAWRERLASLTLLGQVHDPRRWHGVLGDAALSCLDRRLLRSALAFQTALVDSARRWGSPTAISDGLARRASIRNGLGFNDLAASDLDEARRLVTRIGDRALAEMADRNADEVEGALLLRTEPERAAAALERALGYLELTSPSRTPALHQMLARAQLARGLEDEAERQLEEGIREVERQRLSLRDAALQASFFEQAVPLFDDMVALQAEARHDPDRALAYVERGRARQLADSIASPLVGGRPDASLPLDPAALQRALPDGVALVYLVSRKDRLLSWALTRDHSRFEEQPLSQGELRSLVAANGAALERRAGPSVLRETSGRLYDVLVRPLDPVLRSEPALVLVPDAVLEHVAFAALRDEGTGRYLVEDHLVGLAPSGTVFVHASAAAATSRAEAALSVVAVGNPRLDRETGAGLPSLPGAQAEAMEVAGLYAHAALLTGSEATKHAFLERLRTSEVVHFAGHGVSGDAPGSARLLFAPDAARADPGALYVHELDGRQYRRARVVVLAACRTAAGPVSRVEGAWSLARPFLASGVPSVVASLWDVDDAQSRGFFVAFHRALLADGDPLVALRRAQLALLRGGDPSLAHPASWAGFVSIGGLDPRQLSHAPFPAAARPL